MLRLQSIINASDSLSFCSVGRRRTLKSIGSAQNVIFRTHITSRNENVLSAIPSTNTLQSSSSRLFFRNSTLLKVSCVNVSYSREIHTHIIPRCQAGRTNQMNNINLKVLIKEDVGEGGKENKEKELRKKHSEKQLLHKQMAFHSEILKEFPIPNSSLHNVYSIIQSQLKIDQALTMNYIADKQGWTCNCRVKWPEDREFTATDRSKKVASTTVALQCLHWLKDIKKIKNGLPVVFDFKKIQASLHQPSKISVKPELQLKLKKLLLKYENTVKPIISKAEQPKLEGFDKNAEVGNFLGDSFFSNVKQRNIISIPRIHPEDRDFELRKRLRDRRPLDYELPINSYKAEILKKIEENQILLIKGDTGCGKTTQVPQFIMDSFAKRSQASMCNMIVTQPRRISAISLAERIAHERGEKLGDVVGYKVKLRHVLPVTPGAILFCTTGILVNKLQDNPNLIGCSHLIVDEAHERKVDIDMVLALLRRVVKKNKEIKVIIMSATLNADLFQNYFDCASLEIPGKAYPVKMHFMEEICDAVKLKMNFDNRYFGRLQVECERIAKMVQWISDNKPPGAILCFLPGWNEIARVEKFLQVFNTKGNKQLVLPIHSQLSHYDQQKIFEKPPKGVRKIILATDIAETGITVPDVVYVVDSATHKEIRWDKEKEVDTMQSYRISQANLHQRRGRAGRVQPGESFHFISKAEYQQLKPYPVPEIKCVSLERVALDCKLCTDDKIEDFLSQFPEPPDPHVVSTSVQNLVKMGALDQEERLTVLGKKMGAFTLPPVLGKTVIYSSIFNCVDPILTLATLFSMNIEVFRNAMMRKEEIRSVKTRFNSSSDHLALSWMYMQWEAYFNKNDVVAERFCDESGLNTLRMLTVKKLRDQYKRQLCQSLGMREKLEANPALSRYSQSDEMVRAVILAGADHVVKHVGYEKHRDRVVKSSRAFQDENGYNTNTTPESVNHLREVYPSPYLTYIKKTFCFERRRALIRDSSMISPLTVMLFSQGHVFGYEHHCAAELENEPVIKKNFVIIKISGKDNVSLLCEEDLTGLLFQFRDSIWAVVRYLIDNQGLSIVSQPKELEFVDQYRNEMLKILDQLLTAAAKPIENGQIEEDQNPEIDPLSVKQQVD